MGLCQKDNQYWQKVGDYRHFFNKTIKLGHKMKEIPVISRKTHRKQNFTSGDIIKSYELLLQKHAGRVSE